MGLSCLLGTTAIARKFANLIRAREERIVVIAEVLRVQAEAEVVRLRSLGWTQSDFARALTQLLQTGDDE